MKIKGLLALTAMALPFGMSAVPVPPGVQKVVNPDGSVVEIRAHGDEYFSYFTDAENSILMEKNSRGFMVPLQENGVVMNFNQSNLDRLAARIAPQQRELRQKRTVGSLDSNGQAEFPTLGEIRCLIVLLEFPDQPFTPKTGYESVQEFFHDWANKDGFDFEDQKGSIGEYYREGSRGKFNPVFDVSPVVRLSHPESYYVAAGTQLVGAGKYGRFTEALEESLKYLDDKIDFSVYDNDGDDEIDYIYFLYSGYSQASTTPSPGSENFIWPHSGTARGSLVLDGKKFATYATSNELRGGALYTTGQKVTEGIGTVAHEFGHVLGLPDLYDPNYVNNARIPGPWSIMCDGSYNKNGTRPPYYTAYESWVCRWLDFEDIKEAGHYKLQPLSSDVPTALKLPIELRNYSDQYVPNEYYLIEYRDKKGWDEGIPTPGILIWHVNYNSSTWRINRVNSDFDRPNCMLVGAAEIGVPKRTDSTYPDKCYWPYRQGASAIDYIAPETNNELIPYNGRYNTELFRPYITSMKVNTEENVGEFDYNLVKETPTGTTEIVNIYRLEGKNQVNVEWKAVEGAKSYTVSLTRKNSSGSVFTVNNLNNTNVGNVTSLEINNITTLAMTQEMTLTVRVNFDIPSSQSIQYMFVPEELSSGNSGVGELETSSVVIAGGNGCVFAPQGAEVYNLSGVRTGDSGLAAGVYIVRYGNVVKKVVVK